VRGADGDKLSKQNGATPIDTATPEAAGRARHGRARARPRPRHGHILCADALAGWVPEWRALYNSRP
jgi:glutamyl-Q tRNA(Asp) synthetase